MAITWQFFSDAGMTIPLALLSLQVPDVGGVAEAVVYFGSTAAGKTLQAASNPGTDAIMIAPIDSNGATGLETSNIKLALSYAGLSSATAGASLGVGTTRASGSALAIYVRLTTGAKAVGEYVDLALRTNAVLEA